ncbi:MAG: PEP-CTERM sorting domain-containing protein [Verrucomicrobia bacterium]|nr:PEP-CTERM sorting domain-containing protein [Verrucomicrobiota bacterium]MDA1068671.1 PEP-CTERM sorting domain-containing protein [Verrucomicrobiota bacterium]
MTSLFKIPGLLAIAITVLSTASEAAEHRDSKDQKVLFIGNSFTYGGGSAVQYYRTKSVTDLNDSGKGGVPALFKAFTVQAGLDFDVYHELIGGSGIDRHLAEKSDVLAKSWDQVVMHGFSTLDRNKPGDPAVLVSSAKQMAELLHKQNSKVNIRLEATWSRADQTYPEKGHWHGKTIDVMAKDVRAAYNLAADSSPFIGGVIPVGEAWNRAMATGVADPNPYDGIAFGQVDLWTHDHYHGGTYGYYLSALVVFGELTGLDPRSLGEGERCAFELGVSKTQAAALQQVAFDELSAAESARVLKKFQPVALSR